MHREYFMTTIEINGGEMHMEGREMRDRDKCSILINLALMSLN